MLKLDFKIDVTNAARLSEPAHIAVTVHLPEPEQMHARPVVCFAKPGGGYSRGYFTCDLPGPAKGAQAEWHAQRGWIFVSVDHLGVGESSLHAGEKLDYTTLAAGSEAAEAEVLRRLADGTLSPKFPKIDQPLKLGIGQSMGGCMTIIQQGHYHGYDGIGILGYGAMHTHPPQRPGNPPLAMRWIPRNSAKNVPPKVINSKAIAEAAPLKTGLGRAMAWGFHYDDVDPAIIARDLAHFDRGFGDSQSENAFETPPWSSLTLPGAVSQSCLTPGCVLTEAAAVRASVLVAMGERDVIADPKGEPRAYMSARSVDLYVCPRMGHMHNFAGTRELLWQRIQIWSEWVREMKAANG